VNARTLNLRRKKLTCLRCGRRFWTDRCHRVCSRCTSDTKEPFVRHMFAAEGLSFPGEYRLAEELGFTDDDTETTTFDESTCEEL